MVSLGEGFRVGFRCVVGGGFLWKIRVRDGETTIKVKFALLRGGPWGQRGKSSKMFFLFSWETPRR